MRLKLVCALLGLATCWGIASRGAAEDWTQFRGPNATGVATRLQALADWRARQGYNVIMVSTTTTGTSTTSKASVGKSSRSGSATENSRLART